ncbi:IS3 family transposase [Clostridium botulinum]|uniref:IS3 family transposase n=1 Tax=Clostridium botulinum TaxID=1491 RepID=UPI001C9AACC4|nr:IS3 family transposase [Clostridium botulinum]MBY6889399.1 IS3 family transposase [Clostridium botulinum]
MICKSNKFSAIHNLRDKYPISIFCEISGVSRNDYYNWLKSDNKPDKDRIIKEHILEDYNSSKNTYGYRRIYVALYKHYNIIINHKKVLRLMRELNIKSLIMRKRFKYNIPKFQSDKVDLNILNRDFTDISINKKWSTDITYLYYGKNRNRLYLSAIKDLCNNEIISYEMSTNLDNSFVLNTVKKQSLCCRRRPKNP